MVKFTHSLVLALTAIAVNAVPFEKRIAQTIADSTAQWVAACNKAGGGQKCSDISVTAFSTLLAAAGPCDQQNSADAMIDLAKQLNNDPDMIKFAQIFAQQPRNTPTSESVQYCQQAPKNAELNGLFQCQFQGAKQDTFVGGVKVGSPGTIPFGQTTPLSPPGSCPANPTGPIPDGQQLVDITQDPGLANVKSESGSAAPPASSAPAASSAPVVSSAPVASSAAPASSAAAVSSAAPSAASSAAASTGTCTPKTRKRGAMKKRIAQDTVAAATPWEDACNKAGGGQQCNPIAVTAFGTLLAAADPCAQQDSADAMIDLAKQLNNDPDMIRLAQIFAQQPRNSPTSQAVQYCQKAPKNAELQGLFQCQFQGSSQDTFVGGVKVGSPGTIPFGLTSPVSPPGSCPANPSGPIPDGQQLVDITQQPKASGSTSAAASGSSAAPPASSSAAGSDDSEDGSVECE